MAKKQPVTKQTPSITEEQLTQLREIMPNIFSEGKIDFEKLHATLGDFGNENPERYSFSWAGKRDAIRILQTPSRATLIPALKESVDFDKTQNIFIEGDNLEVLKLLYKPYFGQVKMIYIDPPYNTGNDFVYPDNFADPLDTYLKLTGQKDSAGNLLTSNAETSGRYHSAWLSMMYPRLFLARQLLREDGVIFISIGDNEMHNLQMVMNEIFGEENFISSISRVMKTGGAKANFFTPNVDFILVYAKNILSTACFRATFTKEQVERYYNKQEIDGERKGEIYGEERLYKASLDHRPNQRYWIQCPDGSFVIPPGVNFPKKVAHGMKVLPNAEDGVWKWIFERYDEEFKKNNIVFKQTTTSALVDENGKQSKWNIYNKLWLKDQEEKGVIPSNFIDEFENRQSSAELKELNIPFDFAKPVNLLKYLLQISVVSDDDIVLDFFSGSATIAQAILELNRDDGSNRKFILVQLPEPTENKEFPTIAEIGKERIRRVIQKMKKEREGQLKLGKPEDLGFKVFKLRESNYKQWDESEQKDPKAYAKQMEMLADPLVKGWKEEDVLYEVALKEGYGLNVIVEDLDVKGIRKVTDPDKEQGFYLCIADKVKLMDLKTLNLKKDDLFICRDIALDDETAANLSLQCRLKTI